MVAYDVVGEVRIRVLGRDEADAQLLASSGGSSSTRTEARRFTSESRRRRTGSGARCSPHASRTGAGRPRSGERRPRDRAPRDAPVPKASGFRLPPPRSPTKSSCAVDRGPRSMLRPLCTVVSRGATCFVTPDAPADRPPCRRVVRRRRRPSSRRHRRASGERGHARRKRARGYFGIRVAGADTLAGAPLVSPVARAGAPRRADLAAQPQGARTSIGRTAPPRRFDRRRRRASAATALPGEHDPTSSWRWDRWWPCSRCLARSAIRRVLAHDHVRQRLVVAPGPRALTRDELPSAVAPIGTVPQSLPLWRTAEQQLSMPLSNLAVRAVGGMAAQVRFLQKQGIDLDVRGRGGIRAVDRGEPLDVPPAVRGPVVCRPHDPHGRDPRGEHPVGAPVVLSCSSSSAR